MEPGRDVPVIGEADVIISGGGPGGVVAAIASARAGADTVLIERYGFLGGTATAGLMASFNGFRNEIPPMRRQTVKGIAEEIVTELIRQDGIAERTAHSRSFQVLEEGCPLQYTVGFDPEVLKYVMLKMAIEAGVEIRLHTYATDAIVEDNAVKGVFTYSKSGREAILGKVTVDATGDADIAASAGAEVLPLNEDRLMGVTMMYRVGNVEPEKFDFQRQPNCIVYKNTAVLWGAGVQGIDCSKTEDLTKGEIEARKKTFELIDELRKTPGFENCFLLEMASHVGVRETRRIRGEYVVTEEDALDGVQFPDQIAISSNPVPNYYGERLYFKHEGFGIPYRALIPKDIDGLVLAGRCISCEQVPFQSARSMAPLMAISQASGLAAALAAQMGVQPRDLDVDQLRSKLLEDGAVF